MLPLHHDSQILYLFRPGCDGRPTEVRTAAFHQAAEALVLVEAQSSRNQWRSPTAERVFGRYPGICVRSAGTSPNARKHVSVEDVRWADLIFVMEEKHKSRLVAEFTRVAASKRIHVLDIPDDYRYMDPELVEQLKEAVEPLLNVHDES